MIALPMHRSQEASASKISVHRGVSDATRWVFFQDEQRRGDIGYCAHDSSNNGCFYVVTNSPTVTMEGAAPVLIIICRSPGFPALRMLQ